MFLKSLQNGRGHKDSNTIKWPEVKLMKLTSLSNSKDKMDGLKKEHKLYEARVNGFFY